MSDLPTVVTGGAINSDGGRPGDPGAPEEPHELQLTPALDLGEARRVTEIRVHGVGGATPQSMLFTDTVEQVAGDRVSGFYRAPDPAPGRHLEAYSWGGYTSHSHLRALWVFLLPFMLANLAGWTSGGRARTEAGRGPVHGFRLAAAKWGALALTLSVLMTFALMFVDVVAYQCGAQVACATSTWWLAPVTWGDLPRSPAHRIVLGGLLMAGVLTVFAGLSYASRRRYESVEPPWHVGHPPQGDPLLGTSAAYLPDGLASREFWSGRLAHTRLTRVHVAAGFAAATTVVALCTMHIPEAMPDHSVAVLRVVSLALAGAAGLLAIAVLGADRLAKLEGKHQWPSAVVLAVALLGFLVAVVAGIRQGSPPQLTAGQTPGITAAFNSVWAAIAALLIPLAASTWRRRQFRRGRDRDAIGWIPPYAATGLGIIVAQVVLLSLLIFLASRLSSDAGVKYENLLVLEPAPGRQSIVLPPLVPKVTAYFVWGIAALLAVFAAWFVLDLLSAGWGRRLTRFLDPRTGGVTSAGDYTTEEEDFLTAKPATPGDEWTRCASVPDPVIGEAPGKPTRWSRTRARHEMLARSSVYVSRLVNSIVTAATGGLLLVWADVFVVHIDPPDLLVGPAVTIALLIPPALALFVAGSWRKLEQRRVIGSLWDVGTFWPRSFHPFAPPCYAERAVPELTRRIWWLCDRGGRVAVAAHSQGSIIAAATALRRDLDTGRGPRFGLVTFGSPLRKLYGHAFPAYWPARQINDLADPARSLVLRGAWRNVHYLTDYIGGPVGIAAVDRRLPDPATSLYVFGQPPPRVRSHTGYLADPRFRAFVDRLSESLEAEKRPAGVTDDMGSDVATP